MAQLILLCFCALILEPQPGTAAEPGQREAQQRDTAGKVITEFTHPAVEARGIWLASRDMVLPKEELRRRLDDLEAANFNAVLIDTYFRGYVAYPGSEIVPQFPDFKGEDILGWLIDEVRARGMRPEFWMEYGFYSYFTPDATKDKSMGPILDAHPELLSVDDAGARFIHRSFGDFYSICPSNPKSHDILARTFAEAVRKYPAVMGVNLDRIRYAESNYCYCDYCRKHFQHDTGIALSKFQPGSAEAKKFLEWKRAQTVKAVETIAAAIRAARPGIAVTSYVVGPDEMDSKAQAWDLWMQKGLLDAVAVSMYGADIRPAAARAIELLGPNRRKLIAAISCGQEPAVYLSNIEISRSFGGLGQYTWHFGDVFDDIDGLKSGPYSQPATSPAAPK